MKHQDEDQFEVQCDDNGNDQQVWYPSFEAYIPVSAHALSVTLPEELFDILPQELQSVAHEVSAAGQVGASRLVVAGLRMLLEAMCAERSVPGADLHTQLAALPNHAQQTIPGISGNAMHALCSKVDIIRWFGNEAVHQRRKHAHEEIIQLFQLIQAILDLYYGTLHRQAEEQRRQAAANALPTPAPSDPAAYARSVAAAQVKAAKK